MTVNKIVRGLPSIIVHLPSIINLFVGVLVFFFFLLNGDRMTERTITDAETAGN